MNIKILSDSTCDLPQDLLQKYDISLIPLTVVKNDVSYKDGVDIVPADIFAHVAAGGALCSGGRPRGIMHATAAVPYRARAGWYNSNSA